MCAFFAYDPTKGAIKVTGDVTASVDDKLGTPGTGEPAHAGGSTGVIGWARDILAKIAAFGTSAAPSADVLSVQEGQLVTSSVLSTSGQTHVALCSGMSEVVFRIYDNASGPSVAPSATTVAAEGWHSAHGSEATSTNWVPIRTVQDSALSFSVQWGESSIGEINPNTWHPNQYIASCVGFEKVRIRLTGTPASPYKVISAVHPSSNRVSRLTSAKMISDGNTTASSTANPLGTFLSTGAYYTDTTTPLAANATFTGSSRTMAAGNNAFNAEAVADQNFFTEGLRIQSSSDGSTWGDTTARSGSAVVFGTASCVGAASIKRTSAFYRVVLINGVNAQSSLRLASSQTPN